MGLMFVRSVVMAVRFFALGHRFFLDRGYWLCWFGAGSHTGSGLSVAFLHLGVCRQHFIWGSLAHPQHASE